MIKDSNLPADRLDGIEGKRIVRIERIDEGLISLVLEDGEHIGFLSELRQDHSDTAPRLRLARGTAQMARQTAMALEV